MKLTPLEIRKQEFRKAMRGFDPIEVITFLEMVSEQYEELLDENKLLNRRLIENETKLKNYQDTEKDLRETLLNVQEVKKQSEESSRRHADLITKEAELKAIEILENSRRQTRQIREEISWLKSQKDSFINRLRHILISQIELLSVMEIDDILPEKETKVVKNWKSRKYSANQPQNQEEPDSENLDIVEEEPLQVSTKKTTPAMEKDLKVKDARIIKQMDEPQVETTVKNINKSPDKGKPRGSNKDSPLHEEDINEFFKRGIQIDDLIKTINKKELKK